MNTPAHDAEKVVLRVHHPLRPAWFWTAEWQDGEREASAELAAGAGTFSADVDTLLAG